MTNLNKFNIKINDFILYELKIFLQLMEPLKLLLALHKKMKDEMLVKI
jgi:hypothetical protein